MGRPHFLKVRGNILRGYLFLRSTRSVCATSAGLGPGALGSSRDAKLAWDWDCVGTAIAMRAYSAAHCVGRRRAATLSQTSGIVQCVFVRQEELNERQHKKMCNKVWPPCLAGVAREGRVVTGPTQDLGRGKSPEAPLSVVPLAHDTIWIALDLFRLKCGHALQ